MKYVGGDGRILFSRLGPATVTALRPFDPLADSVPTPPVNVSRSSVVFELAAVEQIESGQYDEAARLLLTGIEQDRQQKTIIGGRPSIRLFDLLIRLIVRRELRSHEASLELAIQAARRQISSRRPKPLAHRSPTEGRRRGTGSPRTARRGRPSPATAASATPAPTTAFDKRMARWADADWRQRVRGTPQRWTLTVPGTHAIGERIEPRKISVTF